MAAAALTMSTGTASAYPDPGIDWDHIYETTGARVYVEEYGDYISVCDTKANGASAYVSVMEIGYSDPSYSMTASGGVGTCKSHRASDGAKYNLNENGTVVLDYVGTGNWSDYVESEFFNDH
nr:hypothetical protein [Streptomyces coryli]